MDQVTVVNVKWTGNYKHVLDTPRSVAPATGWSLCGLGPTGWAYSWSEAEGVYLANVSLNTCKKCMKALRAKRTPVPAGQPKIRMSFTAAEVLSLAAFARAYFDKYADAEDNEAAVTARQKIKDRIAEASLLLGAHDR
jgi:hypothetical protein